ncbi:unnamed protein product [Gongylonema pulchrum]|uniref:EF-hand domain-containing protein n=1 Tax=Gongylonema pulchrum TaxID=637853 RepID=A0A183EXD7_9BILA|nr:unnamed protein product [Gongylonema pulchrum]
MEFRRVVRASTGHNLNENLVKLLFRIFDTNNDDRLSYTEFIGVMNDRVRRGFKVSLFGFVLGNPTRKAREVK